MGWNGLKPPTRWMTLFFFRIGFFFGSPKSTTGGIHQWRLSSTGWFLGIMKTPSRTKKNWIPRCCKFSVHFLPGSLLKGLLSTCLFLDTYISYNIMCSYLMIISWNMQDDFILNQGSFFCKMIPSHILSAEWPEFLRVFIFKKYCYFDDEHDEAWS